MENRKYASIKSQMDDKLCEVEDTEKMFWLRKSDDYDSKVRLAYPISINYNKSTFMFGREHGMKCILKNKILSLLFLLAAVVLILGGCINSPSPVATKEYQSETAIIDKDGSYTAKDEVALYIHTYGKLPENYITKKEAEKLGWDSKDGNLSDIAPGKSIGGSSFGNYEGLLPKENDRKYYECDIDYTGGYRGAKRIIYSNDGLVFYTDDHYKTFEQLY